MDEPSRTVPCIVPRACFKSEPLSHRCQSIWLEGQEQAGLCALRLSPRSALRISDPSLAILLHGSSRKIPRLCLCPPSKPDPPWSWCLYSPLQLQDQILLPCLPLLRPLQRSFTVSFCKHLIFSIHPTLPLSFTPLPCYCFVLRCVTSLSQHGLCCII